MTHVSKLARAVTLTALACVACLGSAEAAGKKELVAKVLTLQQAGIEGMGTQLANQMAQQVLHAAGQAMGQVPADKRELVGNEIQAEVRKFFEDVSPQMRSMATKIAPSTLGATMEEKLSEDELKAVIAWLESPLSKKYAQINLESQQQMAKTLMTESRPQVEPKLKALEASIRKKLGLPPVGASGPAPAAAKK